MKKLLKNFTKIMTIAAVLSIAFGLSLLTPLAQINNGLKNHYLFAANEPIGTYTQRPVLGDITAAGITPKVKNLPKSTAKLGDTVATKVGTNAVPSKPDDDLQVDAASISGFTYDYKIIESTPGNEVSYTNVTATGDVRIFYGLPATLYEKDTYLYDGNYEYRFYLGEHFADDQYFDSITVNVTKSKYSFSSPITGNNENFVPTSLPSGTEQISFPFPEQINIVKDGISVNLLDKKNINDLNDFLDMATGADTFTRYGKEQFDTAVKEMLKYVRVTVHPNGGNTIPAAFAIPAEKTKLADAVAKFEFGSAEGKIPTTATKLNVSYQLYVGTSVLLSAALTDITIKDFGKNDIEFTGTITPNTPTTMAWGDKVALPQPTIGTSTPTDTAKSLSVSSTEAYTYVKSVKYMTNQEYADSKDWASVTPTAVSNETIELLGGLNVRALQVGYYRFEYRTTTKWGYRHKDTDGNWVAETGFIDYETANVQVTYSSTVTNFIWTNNYELTLTAEGKELLKQKDKDGILQEVEMGDLENFSKYLPTTTSTADNPNTVESVKGIIIPALYAENSVLKQDELDYRIEISGIDSNYSTTYSNNYNIRSSKGYDPTKKLYITFEDEPNIREGIQQYNVRTGGAGGSTEWNDVEGFMYGAPSAASALLGKYKIAMSVYSRSKLNPDATTDSGVSLISTNSARTYYFTVDNTVTTKPTIGEINIDTYYMADGDILDVAVPNSLFADDYTLPASIGREYILNPGDAKEIKIDETASSSGTLSIDLEKYTANIKFGELNTLRVIAHGFNQLQKELYGYPTEQDKINTIDDTFYKDISFKIFGMDNTAAGVNYTFNGLDAGHAGYANTAYSYYDYGADGIKGDYGTDGVPDGSQVNGDGEYDDQQQHFTNNTANFGDALWVKAVEMAFADGGDKTRLNSTKKETYAQNEAIYLPEIIAEITPNTVKTQLSVAVFQIDTNGKRNFTNIYADFDDKPAMVGAPEEFNTDPYAPTGKTELGQFANYYFQPGTAGDYFIFITAKAKASGTYFSFLAKISVKAAGHATVTPNGGSTSLLVGEKGYIPNVTLNVIDDKIIGSDGELNRVETDGTKTPVGYYTTSIRGMGANDIKRGDNSITAKRDGLISVVYSFHLTDTKYSECAGYKGEDPLTYTHNIVVTAIGTADLEVSVNEEYNTAFPDRPDDTVTTPNDNDAAIEIDGLKVMGLNGFGFSNNNGPNSFSVDRSKTNPTWEENQPVYPMIAIPNLNVKGRDGIELYEKVEDPYIKVTYIDNSNITQTLIDTANEDETKRLLKGSVLLSNGYYAFQPQGVFVKLNGQAAATHDDRFIFNNENYTYTITYTTQYGSGEPITTTFTVSTGSREETIITLGDIGKRTNSDGTAVETDPLVYAYATDMDSIKLNITKLSVTESPPFQEYMENWILDNYEVDENGVSIPNNRGNNTTALWEDKYGEYDRDVTDPEKKFTLNEAGKLLSRQRYIAKNIMIYVTVNGAEWAFNENYANKYSYIGTTYDTNKARLDNNMQLQSYITGDIYLPNDNTTDKGAYEKTIYSFTPSMAGTYEVTFSIVNEITQSTASSAKLTLTLTTDSSSTTIKNRAKDVWGWILIILSSGLLIGVVFYFIKTGRDTKFAGAPTPKPEGKKVKADKNAEVKQEEPKPQEETAKKKKEEEKEAK
jgi:hypothetical protein